MYFCYFVIISPWKKAESRSAKDALCQVWLKLAPWFWRRNFKFHQYIFALSQFSVLGKGWEPLFVETWITFAQKRFVSILVEIGPEALEKNIFLNFVNVFSLFCYISLLGKGRGLLFEWTWISFIQLKDALYQVWLKLANWFWRRFKISSELGFFCLWISAVLLWFSLEKGVALHLNKL